MKSEITIEDVKSCFLANNRKTRRDRARGEGYKRTRKNEIIQYWR